MKRVVDCPSAILSAAQNYRPQMLAPSDAIAVFNKHLETGLIRPALSDRQTENQRDRFKHGLSLMFANDNGVVFVLERPDKDTVHVVYLCGPRGTISKYIAIIIEMAMYSHAKRLTAITGIPGMARLMRRYGVVSTPDDSGYKLEIKLWDSAEATK
jgi:hypothetical protein